MSQDSKVLRTANLYFKTASVSIFISRMKSNANSCSIREQSCKVSNQDLSLPVTSNRILFVVNGAVNSFGFVRL
jgi:hypothetical protein